MLFTLVFLCDREPATLSADSWLEKMQHMHLSSCFIVCCVQSFAVSHSCIIQEHLLIYIYIYSENIYIVIYIHVHIHTCISIPIYTLQVQHFYTYQYNLQ